MTRAQLALWGVFALLASAPARAQDSVPSLVATVGQTERAHVDMRFGMPPVLPTGARFVFAPLMPAVWLVNNDRLPFGGNDGALWAGRGTNVRVTGGMAARARVGGATLDVVLAPTMAYSANAWFFTFPSVTPDRSSSASPWHGPPSSADLPSRFGGEPVRRITMGESSARITMGAITAGVSSAADWWGPARFNTLLLGNNAGGVPRGFVSTARPIATRAGWFEAKAIAGVLTESRFFDTDSTNDYRSLSGFRVTYRPIFDSALTVGVARLSMRSAKSRSAAIGHGLDAFVTWESLASPSDTLADGRSRQRADQLLELFFRWAFPASGFETYAEWARMENPRSFTEWLATPHHTQGYTLGLQWVSEPRWRKGRARIESEFTYLEQTTVYPQRPVPDFYTGRATAQGWTNEGQVLGAWTGPGSGHQYIGGDWLAERWRAGAFIGRIQWENDALYRQPAPRPTQHDVTLYSGLRGAVRMPWYDVSGSLTVGRRLNYLFQNDALTVDSKHAIDIQNVTLSFIFAPR